MKRIGWVLAVLLLAGCGGETDPAAVAGKAEVHPGLQTYQRFCFSCHASGMGGAPRPGDTNAWAPRVAMGEAALLRSTIEGIPPAMPAKGLCMQCSEEELAAAIDYLVTGGS